MKTLNIQTETEKIINLLKNEQIEWGEEFSDGSYSITIPPFDDDEFLEDNLDAATVEIMMQLSHLQQAES